METKSATTGTYTRKGNHMKSHPKHDKIHEALALLNEVAVEKKDELWETITEKYTSVKDMVHDAAEDGLNLALQAKKDLLKKLHEEQKQLAAFAHDVDKKVRKNPWPIIGGAAGVSFLIGLLLRRK